MESTAEAVQAGGGSGEFGAGLARVISTLMVLRGVKPQEAWLRLGVSRGTWYNRMRDGEFTAYQMLQLADLFQVPLMDLFEGPDLLLRSDAWVDQNEKKLAASSSASANASTSEVSLYT